MAHMESNGLASASQSQLLIIDVQKKLIPAIPSSVISSVIKNINAMQEMALLLDIPSPITEQYPKGLGPTDTAILNKTANNPTIIEKTSFSCCQASNFSNILKAQREQIIIVGMESHVCVLQTALELLEHGKTVFVIEDAVCSRNKHHHQNALARMANQGVIISNYESLLFEWCRDSKHPHFKTITKLIS